MKKQKFVRLLSVFLFFVCIAVFAVCAGCNAILPNEYTVYKNETFKYGNNKLVSLNDHVYKKSKEALYYRDDYSSQELMLLNIIPIKEVNVHNTEKKYVVPCGELFGIKFYTKGVVVIKCSDIIKNNKTENPGNSGGLEPGDTITRINEKEILCCNDVKEVVSSSKGSSLSVTFERQGTEYTTHLTPVSTDSDGDLHLGLWIRDSCAGLGTMTFYEPKSKSFAALGHGICDTDTGNVLPLDSAYITEAKIAGITKGSQNVTGSINGYFSGSDKNMGIALRNCETGIYGILSDTPCEAEPIEIATIHEIKKGNAQILCTLDNGKPDYYNIVITKINYDTKNKTKNLQIAATDERLLSKTGGIVQGMSGSPILQNGKLVGAVTHVLITNSAKGYGIFAQNMYDDMEKSHI